MASRFRLLPLILLVAVGCTAPGASPTERSASVRTKAITISLEGEINALATELDATGVSGLSAYLHDFIHDYLTVRGDRDEVLAQVAQELPSLEAGTWKVLSDGRMEVTWRLRPGVRWHDGTELTSADVKFGWEVSVDPAAPLGVAAPTARSIEAIETPDPYTTVVRWKQPSRFGGQMARNQVNLLPRHVLAQDFLANKSGLASHPYFTSTDVVVGTGPYRPVVWERGSHLTLEAFDGYYQGRAKIDRVTFRFIRDEQTTLANVLSGAVDVANRGVTYEGTLFVQQEWARTDMGTVQNQPTNFRHSLFQMRPDVANPTDLLDPRVRRALIHGFNREQLVEGIFPGVGPEMVAHSIGFPGTPIGDAVDPRIVRYPFDPRRAMALFEEAGWRPGLDGLLAKPSGERFRLELNASGGDEDNKTFALMEGDYRRLGIELTFKTFGGRRQTPEESARFSGLQKTGLPFNQPTFGARWDSREIAGPENRYSGGNRSGYASPAFDRALDELERSLRFSDELRQWGEAWRILTEDAAVMGLFFVPQPILVRRGVLGPLPANASGSATWRAHTWDVQ